MGLSSVDPSHSRPSRPRRPRRGLRCSAITLLLTTLLAPGIAAAEATSASAAEAGAGSVAGVDVSGHQGTVNWPKAWADGARFAYVKATEGTGFRSAQFGPQYEGAHAAGLIRGAYHFARPETSSGASQAQYFLANGGGWTSDGRTLPGALDIEDNPSGDMCYGMNPAQMSNWIADFSNTYQKDTGRFPAIYTTARWWNRCTGSNPHFGANNPLWIARYSQQLGALPAGWPAHSIWQFSPRGPLPGDQNTFNGSMNQLVDFAS